jgi:hypothetical protein
MPVKFLAPVYSPKPQQAGEYPAYQNLVMLSMPDPGLRAFSNEEILASEQGNRAMNQA